MHGDKIKDGQVLVNHLALTLTCPREEINIMDSLKTSISEVH